MSRQLSPLEQVVLTEALRVMRKVRIEAADACSEDETDAVHAQKLAATLERSSLQALLRHLPKPRPRRDEE